MTAPSVAWLSRRDAGRFALLALLGAIVAAGPAAAQTGAAPARAPDAPTFVRLAYSSAFMQRRAAELAATRETRPEAKAFAQEMMAFRKTQVEELERAAGQNGAQVPKTPEFAHQIIIENLEPLDFLALSRRYAEVQVQALEQELQLYEAAAGGAESWTKTIAAARVPELRRWLERAREMHQRVGP